MTTERHYYIRNLVIKVEAIIFNTETFEDEYYEVARLMAAHPDDAHLIANIHTRMCAPRNMHIDKVTDDVVYYYVDGFETGR